jgi:hypothetical protein
MSNNTLPTPYATLAEAYAASAEMTGRYARTGDEGWGTYHSNVTGPNGYDETFRDVLHGKSVLEIVRPHADRPFVAVDLMASTTALQELFDHLPENIEKRGFALSIADCRSDELARKNDRSGIWQLTGNLALSTTWRSVEAAAGKADLILERSDLGVPCLPRHRSYYAAAFNRIWGMLAIDGTALLELPSPFTMGLAGGNTDYLMDKLYSQHVVAAIDPAQRALRVVKSSWNPEKLDMS